MTVGGIHTNLRRKILLPFTLLLLIVLAGGVWVFKWMQDQHWEQDRLELLRGLEQQFTVQVESQINVMHTAMEMFEHNPVLRDAVMTEDREVLYQEALPMYEKLKQNHQITHFYFTKVDQTNLLRVHQPDRYGDRIDRSSMLRAVAAQAPAWGIEVGPLGTYTLRLVRPLFEHAHGGPLIGYLELGMEIEHLLSALSKSLAVDLVLLLDKQGVDHDRWQRGMEWLGREAEWEKFPRHVLIYSTSMWSVNELEEHSPQFLQRSKKNIDHQLLHQHDGEYVSMVQLSLNERWSAHPGVLVGLKDVSVSIAELQQDIVYLVVGAIGGAMVLLGVIYLFLGRLERWYERQQQLANQTIEDQLYELQQMEMALDQHSIVSVTDPKGNIIEVNDQFCEVSGYRREELIGKNHRILRSTEHPPAFFRHLWKTILSGEVWQGEVKNLRKGGEVSYWVKGTIVPFKNRQGEIYKFISIRTDITENKKLAEDAKQANSRLQSTLDAALEGVLAVDFDGNIVEYNRRFCEIWDLPYQQMREMSDEKAIGLALKQLKDPQQFVSRVEQLYGNAAAVKDDELEFVDGRIIARHTRPQWLEGEVIGRIWTFYDITETRRHEQIQEQLIEQLETASQAKDEFLASMSHELRTPLASIIGNSEILIENCGGDCQEHQRLEILQSIYGAGKNQLAMVNDILDMSKIEAGKFTIEDRPYDLNRMLDGVMSMFSVRARDAGIELQLEQQNKEQYLLRGDKQRVQQILINLIGNAIKFTEQGRVSLSVSHQAGVMLFVVKDEGIGMPQEVVESLFKPFQQADQSISRRFGGSGLGLYISMNLAELMGGKIEVESELGVGSTFTVQLPYQPTVDPVETNATLMPQQTGDDDLFSGHVLIAEDTPELQLLERRILESLGFTVTAVENGEEALAAVKETSFDLVLMDMQMPVMDGIAATHRIRKAGYTVPIVPLTANVMQKHRNAFAAEGCEEFLTKPIDKRELRQVLKRVLSGQGQAAAVVEAEVEVDEELMAIFVESSRNNHEKLSKAFAEQQWEAVRAVAHSVKGSAASFGYPQLSALAEQVQFAVDEERMEQAEEATQQLADALSQLR